MSIIGKGFFKKVYTNKIFTDQSYFAGKKLVEILKLSNSLVSKEETEQYIFISTSELLYPEVYNTVLS